MFYFAHLKSLFQYTLPPPTVEMPQDGDTVVKITRQVKKTVVRESSDSEHE